jgi:Cu2+-exporting ATPase
MMNTNALSGRADVASVIPANAGIDDGPDDSVGKEALSAQDLDLLTVREDGDTASITLLIDNLHCAGCIAAVERGLRALPGVVDARVNFSTRRARIRWREGEILPRRFLDLLREIGYPAIPFDPAAAGRRDSDVERELLRCVSVAGFAAANVMLLSVSVWSGGESMSAATRDLFHWISALLALPAVAYAGRPFFRSALAALASRRLNMDVPISLAVVLATSMSLVETMRSAQHAYFDASVTLLFFLLIGRYLDNRMRAKTRDAAERLLSLNSSNATVIGRDGTCRRIPAASVAPGMRVRVLAGERVPVDGVVESGAADLDVSLVTGESTPVAATPDCRVYAGTLNLNGALTILVHAAGEETLLGEIVRLVENAEQGRARYVRIADRVARFYAPFVHVLAIGTFLGWWLIAGSNAWPALTAAIAVLIITCPCALGLAVPAVQVAAVARLMRSGVLVKSGDALERLAAIDTVVFDKTGTLTDGRPELAGPVADGRRDVLRAAALAAHSRHPLAQALADSFPHRGQHDVAEIEEVPGHGLCGLVDRTSVRIGRRDFCGAPDNPADDDIDGTTELWFRIGDAAPQRLLFRDRLRDDARATVESLSAMGLQVLLLSGDRESAVGPIAAACGIDDWRAGCLPADKVAFLEDAKRQGRHVLMVGDGINDAPALATASVGMSPASGAAISQVAADLVFLGRSLEPVAVAKRVASKADRIVRQNFSFAIAYNLVAIPIAVAGYATPLIAAIAMSSSSIVVTLNALRVRGTMGR